MNCLLADFIHHRSDSEITEKRGEGGFGPYFHNTGMIFFSFGRHEMFGFAWEEIYIYSFLSRPAAISDACAYETLVW
jgi:hypothetical protein